MVRGHLLLLPCFLRHLLECLVTFHPSESYFGTVATNAMIVVGAPLRTRYCWKVHDSITSKELLQVHQKAWTHPVRYFCFWVDLLVSYHKLFLERPLLAHPLSSPNSIRKPPSQDFPEDILFTWFFAS